MLTFQQIVQKLSEFWEKQGCILHFGHDLETGAGTLNPATFLRCLGPEPYRTAYVEPSRRPSDGRYGENPNRLQLFHQFQVIIKPSPMNILELYKASLEAIGISLKEHDLRFVHDDWEAPTLGAFGLGWEVWIDGMEVSQFTYFQAVASLPLKPISVEITYGLERLCMYVQNTDNFFQMQWNESYSYGEITKQNEVEWSTYNFTEASTQMWLQHFEDFEKEAKQLIEKELPLPAYDFVIKASHAFNILDARGVISTTERVLYIARVRELSRLIASAYLEKREKQGFPLLQKLPKEEEKIEAFSLPEKFDPMKKGDFLLEIGSEELPAIFIPIGMKSLESAFRSLCKEKQLSFEEIEPFGAPRRLGVVITGLQEGTLDKKIEKKGPSLKVAFTNDGNLTVQGEGFVKSCGFKPAQYQAIKDHTIEGLEIRGEHLFAIGKEKGQSVYEILSNALPKLILALDFPKKMRWGSLEVVYPRPIQWIACMYEDQVIPFTLGNRTASCHSFGHSQLDPVKIHLHNAKEYFNTLREHRVLARVEERKQSILQQLKTIEEKLEAQALVVDKVLLQVLHLTEWPMLTYANFKKEFLQVPAEVLISEMVEHQKYFPLADSEGQLKNMFVITADNTPSDLIRAGNQKVLSARLADGVFLYRQDLNHPLEEFNAKLQKITFQKELGSLLEKVHRLQKVAKAVNAHLKLSDEKTVERAALLCKADLASGMVKEFPELQGTIGRYYAAFHKENEEIATAIEEHWLPKMEGGSIPVTSAGIVLGLADKLDNLMSYFKVGLKPSSSSDPHALRRQAIGIIRILIENRLSFNLTQFLTEEELSFITSRAKGIYEDMGFAKDEIEAALMGVCNNPYEQYCKIEALHALRGKKEFQSLFEIYKRVKGLLEKAVFPSFNEKLAKEPAEKELAIILNRLENSWELLMKEKRYAAAFEAMLQLQQPLADLFDTVKILADDPVVRDNRLALLYRVFSYFELLLDFSKIQG